MFFRSADPKQSENGEAKIAKQDKVENNSGKGRNHQNYYLVLSLQT